MAKKHKKALVISSFPPKHCGIATYAQDHVTQLKREGYVVYTQTFDDESAASYRFSNESLLGLVKAIIFAWIVPFDAVFMHFTNGLIWPRGRMNLGKRIFAVALQYIWLVSLAVRHGKKFTLIGHEITVYKLSRLAYWCHGLIYRSIANFKVHTKEEKANILTTFAPLLREKHVQLLAHDTFLTKKFKGGRTQARARLGIPPNQCVLLCIGFIQRHKGFDNVVNAMKQVRGLDKRLYIVGSVRIDGAEYWAYRDELRDQVERTENCQLVEKYIDDEEFDMWIAAADAVVLPYREIWSSGVGARAKLFGTRIIARDHPNLQSQFEDYGNRLIYDNENKLVELIEALEPSKLPVSEREAASPLQSLAAKKILVVMPTFGAHVKGGAETFTFNLVSELVKRGANIEVWTTDSTEVVRRNHAAKGGDADAGLPFVIKRFPANVRAEFLFDRVHRFMNQEGRCGRLCRAIWKRTNLHGTGMEEELTRRQDEFDVIHLFHYLLGSSHRLCGIAPHKTLLHPFAHDEPPLRNPIMRDLFAHVRGVTCNTSAEWEWASKAKCSLTPNLFRPIGNGVEKLSASVPDKDDSLDAFGKRGYLLFMGRLIAEKNIPLLLSWYESAAASDPSCPHLVLIGEGPLANAQRIKAHAKIHYLGWLDQGRKIYAIRNALALVNLSQLESFSLVMMEAWLEQTLPIVHRHCPATYGHVQRSDTGFAVATESEFRQAVQTLQLWYQNGEQYEAASAKGRDYVIQNYSWDRVCTNYAEAVIGILGE